MSKIKDNFINAKNKIKNHFKSFVKEEDGFEFLQLVVVIAITAVLAGIIWNISTDAQGKLEDARSILNEEIDIKGKTGGGAAV